MKAELIKTSNNNAEAKLRLMLIDTFKPQPKGEYSLKFIKEKLRSFYTLLQIRNPDGSIKTAKATQLNDFGLFKLEKCKIENKVGPDENGLRVISGNYTLNSIHKEG